MTVNGNGFVSGATVKWNGSPRTTTFVSSNQLSAAILSADVASQKPVDVMVNNPGSGASSPVAFSILPEWIFPSITALVPPQVRAGSTGMSVDVNGLHFTPKTVARWNGSDRSTEYLSSNLLRFVVPATDIANEGTAQITLYDPGTGTSDPVAFAITPPVNPVPVLTSISPAQAFAACAWFDMTVRGSNFVNLSYVTIDGLANFRTNYVSPEELTVAINATGALLPGNHEVKVHNLTPGGGASIGLIFTMVRGTPNGRLLDLVSLSDGGFPAKGSAGDFAMSRDGRYVTFAYAMGDLVAGDLNGWGDIFVRDTCEGAPESCRPSTMLVSVASNGSQSQTAGSYGPSISDDGRIVVFSTQAKDLVPGCTTGTHVVWHDRDPDGNGIFDEPGHIETRCLPAPEGGHDPYISGSHLAISSTGRYVAFVSFDADLVPDDTNDGSDIFLHDTCFGALPGCKPSTIRVSVASDGSEGRWTGYADLKVYSTPPLAERGRAICSIRLDCQGPRAGRHELW